MKDVLRDLWKSKDPRYGNKIGINDFFILVLVYNYYNNTDTDEFMLLETILAKYFNRTTRTIRNWFNKMRTLGFIEYATRDDAGQTKQYIVKNRDTNTIQYNTYTVPKYKRKYINKDNCEFSYANIYKIDMYKLNSYIRERLDIDVLENIEQYNGTFSNFIKFLVKLKKKDTVEVEGLTESLTIVPIKETNVQNTKRENKIKRLIKKNNKYLELKDYLDTQFPGFESRYLKENCLRLTSDICSTNSLNSKSKKQYKRSRLSILHQFFNTTNKDQLVEYDTNASIYRLTYNLNHNELLDDNLDIYEQIWINCGFNPKLYRKSRLQFKQLLMPVYMREQSLAYKINQYQYVDKYYKNKLNCCTASDREMYLLISYFVDLLKLDCKTILTTVKIELHNILNVSKFYKSDIFIHESNLHLLMRKKFLDKGIRCIHVYDGFYFKKDEMSQELFNSIYNESTIELKQNLT